MTRIIYRRPSPVGFWAKVMFSILFICIIINHIMITYVQPEPYMDEVFHVPQTQQFCRGNFGKWDNKITTLPGLYIVPSILSLITGGLFPCSTFILRSLNVVITLAIYWIFYFLVGIKNPKMDEKKQAFTAYTLTIFPLNYFFTYLYYTDQLSTFLTVLMSYLAIRKYVKTSALLGAYAIFTRQTNVVWVLWTTILVTWDILQDDLPKWIKYLLCREASPPVRMAQGKYYPGLGRGHVKGMSLFQANVIFVSDCIVKIAPKVLPFTLVLLCFAGFVIFNQGIVVGDRTAHQVTPNVPQLFYFAFFVGAMLSPSMILFGLPCTIRRIWKYQRFFFLLTIFGLMVVYLNTVEHPYLLADNRHYTFYVWKRLYQFSPYARYCLVPISVGIWFWIWNRVKLDQVMFLGFILCLGLNLIPQKLLEYRYFVLPYFILRLEMRLLEWKHLIPECILYSVINMFTVYQFVARPFVQQGFTDVSRFMW